MLRSPFTSTPKEGACAPLSRLPTRCKHCRVKFTKEERGLRLHPTCIEAWAEAWPDRLAAENERKRAKAARVERAFTRAELKARRKLPEFRAAAQEAFNKYIRARDANLPCVSCGVIDPPMTRGGQWDAGHFLGRGAYPELAFDEDNCHKQCKSCNGGGGKFSHKGRTVNEKYETELPNRIGAERLARLKGPHEPKKYTREDYEAIEATYKAKRKELEGQT